LDLNKSVDYSTEKAGLRIFDLEGNGPYTLEQLLEALAMDTRWDCVGRLWR